jgi:hypothetical protein
VVLLMPLVQQAQILYSVVLLQQVAALVAIFKVLLTVALVDQAAAVGMLSLAQAERVVQQHRLPPLCKVIGEAILQHMEVLVAVVLEHKEQIIHLTAEQPAVLVYSHQLLELLHTMQVEVAEVVAIAMEVQPVVPAG